LNYQERIHLHEYVGWRSLASIEVLVLKILLLGNRETHFPDSEFIVIVPIPFLEGWEIFFFLLDVLDTRAGFRSRGV
jgi:hypothetical protein